MFALESVAAVVTGCLLTALVGYVRIALLRLIVPGDLSLVKYVSLVVLPHFALCILALTAGLLGIGPGAPVQGVCIFIFGEAIILLARPRRFISAHEAFVSLKYFSPARFGVSKKHFHVTAAKVLLAKLFVAFPNAIARFERTEKDSQLRLIINDTAIVDLYVNSELRFFEGLELSFVRESEAKCFDDVLAVELRSFDGVTKITLVNK